MRYRVISHMPKVTQSSVVDLGFISGQSDSKSSVYSPILKTVY